MGLKIRKACVLGSGVMGAQIAAHLAAAGVRTHLLDLPASEPPADPKLQKVVGKNVRSTRAILAIDQLAKLKPPPLMSKNILPNLIPGNFEDDWSVLADCDWIIEAVIEKLDIKQNIHKRISEVARPHIPITTNTSGIPLRDICKELPEHYGAQFFGTHFFNPPRYMHLVEIIPHAGTNQDLMNATAEWISERLGKGIVHACDTINFIANRIGVLSIQATLKHMNDLNLNIETVDALTGPLIGHPKSATMRTMDVVGLDTFVHVATNVYQLVKNDPFHSYFATPEWISQLVKKGHIGQKSGNVGCYKKEKADILVYRPESGQYVPQEPQTFKWQEEAAGIRDTLRRVGFIFKQAEHCDGAKFLWRLHRDIFSYAALLIDEIAAGDPKAVDDAMRWGFNWEWGPFELWQGIGFDPILKAMQEDKATLPAWAKTGVQFYKPAPGVAAWQLQGPQETLQPAQNKWRPVPKKDWDLHLPKAQTTDDKRVVLSNKSASLVDLGDGVACLTFHSKMNTLNDEIIELTQKAIAKVNDGFCGMVIGNQGEQFSAGANLKSIVEHIENKAWNKIDDMIRAFQGTMQLIKFAPFPTVSCPHGLTLGGGCETSLHAGQVLLAGDTFAGLVEVGVGLIPAGGGTKELALRAYKLMSIAERGDPMPFLQKAFMLIGMGQVSSSGQDAIDIGLYPTSAKVSLSKERQIARAKLMALAAYNFGYAPPIPAQEVAVVGDPGIQTFKLALYNMKEGHNISAYDSFVGEKVATVLCGGEVDGGTIVNEQHFLDLERRVFVELCRETKTKERIVNMLKTGKPLRN